MKKEMLRLEDVAGSDPAGLLRDANLCLYEGELLGVVGLSSSGLQELTELLTGNQPAAAGQIWVEGNPAEIATPQQAYRLGIRMLRGSAPLNDTLTVAENMILTTFSTRRMWLLSRRKMNALCRHYLELVEADISPDARAGTLTTAQQGFVMLAKAAYEGGRIVILDNILPYLTPREFAQLLCSIRRMAQHGFSFIMTSYSLQSGFFEADRAVVLRDGRTAGVVQRPAQEQRRLYRMLLGGTNPPEGRSPCRPAKTALRAEGLRIAGCRQPCSFSIRQGEICGLFDEEDGEAKRLVYALCGLTPDSWLDGQVWLDGNGYRFRTVAEAMRAGVVYLPENPVVRGLFSNLSIGDNLLIPALQKLRPRAGIVGQRMHDYLEKSVEISAQGEKGPVPAGTLDVWDRWRVLLERLRLMRPRVAILLQPSAHIDENLREYLYDSLRDLSSTGVSILVLTRDPRDIDTVCDRLLLL